MWLLDPKAKFTARRIRISVAIYVSTVQDSFDELHHHKLTILDHHSFEDVHKTLSVSRARRRGKVVSSTAVEDLSIRRHLVVSGLMGVAISNTRNTRIEECHRKE